MILITGATGTNGSLIVKNLSALGVPVRAMVRSRAQAGEIAGPGVELVEGDYANPASIEAALQGVEKTFLLPPVDAHSVDYQRNFAAAAKQSGVQHIVKLSVIGADPQSPARFVRWHGEGDVVLKESGISTTLLQPNSFMQNMLQFAPQIASQGAFFVPAENARISHVDARDIAAIAVKALTETGHEGNNYVITGPEALTYGEIAEKLSRVVGKPVQYVNISPEQFKQALLGVGAPEWQADAVNELYTLYRAGEAAVVTDTVARIAPPPTTFDQFAHDHAAAFRRS